jgi:hypothetical protein
MERKLKKNHEAQSFDLLNLVSILFIVVCFTWDSFLN